jgi:secreted Zn-dependent insulinase-like peptidase
MGTTKFPDENGYDKYLSAAGGHSVRPSICSNATSENGG